MHVWRIVGKGVKCLYISTSMFSSFENNVVGYLEDCRGAFESKI